MAGAAPGAASGNAARRLRRELESLRKSEVPQIAVQPSEDNLLEWHFVLHSFGSDLPYCGGCYHGKIIFPAEYPLAPPSILMVTPSGRLETGKRLCLSMTDFHPESWNPAWSVETILVGLLSFFVSDKESGYGAMTASEARRKQFAAESHAANMRDAEFVALFPEFAAAEAASSAADAPSAAAAAAPPSPTAVAPEAAGDAAPQDGTESFATVADIEVGVANSGEPGAAAGAEAEEPVECWMCREVTDEPLIQPCACRGSMSGVHASCVQEWIRHHRRNAVNAEPPRCSVCNQFYQGREQQPGVGVFLRQAAVQGSQQLLRTLLLVVLVCGYQAAAEGKAFGLPIVARVLIIVVFSLFAVHKLAVLTVSLPLHRPPPQHALLRRLFVSDHTRLSKHMAEAFATIVILAFGCATQTLPFVYFMPFGLAAMIPVAKVCFSHGPSVGCLVGFGQFVVACIAAPFICVAYPLVWTVRHPRTAAKRLVRSLSPLGPGPQIYVSIAAVVLCLACDSNIAPVVLWISHSAVALAGLVELCLVKKLRWQRDQTSAMAWLLSLQLTALTTYFANTLCVFPLGWGAPDNTLDAVHGFSCLWFLLVCVLTVKVNWAFLMERYRVWQRRHGEFTLQVGAGPNSQAPLREPGGSGGAAAAPPV